MVDTGTEALDNIATLAANLNELVERLRDRRPAAKALAQSIAGIADIVKEIQKATGLLHSLIYDDYEGEASRASRSRS